MAPPKGFIPWNKGKKNIYSQEVIESNRQKHLGKKLSQEHKDKIALKMQQRKLSDEHKKKIGQNTTLKLSGRIKGPLSEEVKKKISKKLKGKPKSEEHKNKLKGTFNGMYGVRGDKHPSWLGGLKLLPYDKKFNKWFKEDIKTRDNWCCFKCGMWEPDHKLIFKNQSLQVHHINYNKQMTIKENCCALCCRCNAEVNYNRKAWTKFFQTKLNERYNYKYSEDGDIIIEGVDNESIL